MRFMMIVIPKGYESAAPDAVPGAEAVAKTRRVHLGAVQSCETGMGQRILVQNLAPCRLPVTHPIWKDCECKGPNMT